MPVPCLALSTCFKDLLGRQRPFTITTVNTEVLAEPFIPALLKDLHYFVLV